MLIIYSSGLQIRCDRGRKPNMPMIEENCSLEKIRWEFYLKLYYSITQISPEYL